MGKFVGKAHGDKRRRVFMLGNVIVGQSGGPTAVINSSLAGVYKTAKDLGANKVYGKRHGLCLETQYYPDSINKKEFPSCVFGGDKEYDSVTVYKFS